MWVWKFFLFEASILRRLWAPFYVRFNSFLVCQCDFSMPPFYLEIDTQIEFKLLKLSKRIGCRNWREGKFYKNKKKNGKRFLCLYAQYKYRGKFEWVNFSILCIFIWVSLCGRVSYFFKLDIVPLHCDAECDYVYGKAKADLLLWKLFRSKRKWILLIVTQAINFSIWLALATSL